MWEILILVVFIKFIISILFECIRETEDISCLVFGMIIILSIVIYFAIVASVYISDQELIDIVFLNVFTN